MIGESVYTKLDDDLDKEEDTPDTAISSIKFDTPTLSGIAQKVAKVKKKLLLEPKQYIAREIICCTFLLGLIRDGEDKST